MSISILIVEDQDDIRGMLQALLEREGYLVSAAAGAEEALARLGRLPRPCLLLWDAMTPRDSLTLVDQATLEGVHVAAIPVSVSSIRLVGASREITKRLTSEEAVLTIVREHCPLPSRASAQGSK
jgi:CheY-like chemotaxis protein